MSRLSILTAAALLAACATDTPPASRGGGGAFGAALLVEAADWSRAEIVTLSMVEFAFDPKELTLRANQPYRLRIRNDGKLARSFAAPEFIRGSAVRGVVPLPGEIRPTLTYNDVPLSAGGAKEMSVIPVAKGRYEMKSGAFGESMLGLIGAIVVE
ncbi:MAG: hypothetical protein FJX46_01250 [Alphaproteobacteria bacterium]|nr:hypothetical protein [Alphaproteobacteria bacterium]